VQIITNNALVYKDANMIVETKYRWVFWTPCISHSLNLALKFVASDVTRMGDLIDDACHICRFVQNYTHAPTIYKDHTNLSLLKIEETQFVSLFTCLRG
jgi:hypothetical protein